MKMILGPFTDADADQPQVRIPVERLTLAKRRWRGVADDGEEFGFDLEAPLTDARIGCGPLARGGWVVKCVADGSIALRRTLAAVRRELHAALGRREPSLRRAGWV